MRSLTKVAAYEKLVAERKACRACLDLLNPAMIAGGALDSDEIGPYSLWQADLDAQLLVVGQDFADEAIFRLHRGRPGERARTNLHLVRLLAAAGITVDPPGRGRHGSRLFFTNAVLCMKTGGMQAAIAGEDYCRCARSFLRPLIELVRPRAVATLGRHALLATLSAFELPAPGRFLDAVEVGTTFDLGDGTRLFPMAHPSPSVVNTIRSMALQEADWRRLGAWLDR